MGSGKLSTRLTGGSREDEILYLTMSPNILSVWRLTVLQLDHMDSLILLTKGILGLILLTAQNANNGSICNFLARCSRNRRTHAYKCDTSRIQHVQMLLLSSDPIGCALVYLCLQLCSLFSMNDLGFCFLRMGTDADLPAWVFVSSFEHDLA